jgi:hypothetical protein
MDDVTSTGKATFASQCNGKVPFKKVAFAKAACQRRSGRVVYRCKHCFHWHVGTPERKEKKFAKRDKLIRLFLEPEWVPDD